MLEDDTVCNGIVEFFEKNRSRQRPGTIVGGKVRGSYKKSTDIHISPKDLENKSHKIILNYIENLNECYLDYLEQWDFLKTFLGTIHIGGFNIQRYDAGGHFNKLHSERTALVNLHRILAWMTYLDDVPDGGETEFPFFGLKIPPEKGKTMIWPAEWTHAHRGAVVEEGPKHIITGWMHFPS